MILVGDLNIAPGDADVHWRHKVVNLAELEALSLGQAASAPAGADSAPQTALKVAAKVGSLVATIREKLRAIEIVKIPGKQGQTEQFNRYARREESYKAVVYNHSSQGGAKNRQTQDLSAPKEVKVGKTFDAEWSPRLRLGCKEYSVKDEATGENHLCWRGDLSVQVSRHAPIPSLSPPPRDSSLILLLPLSVCLSLSLSLLRSTWRTP